LSSFKDFLKPPQKFVGAPEPTNPCEEARTEWDNRDGHVRLQNWNLRRIIWGLIIICIVLTGGLVFESTKSHVETHVIEVDSTTGMAKNVGVAPQQAYTPKDSEIKYFLSEFIRNTRGVPLDPVVFSQNWNKAYAYMTKGAAGKMSTMMQKEPPSMNLGKKTIQTNILVMVPMSNNSYQVRWTEEDFDIGSGQKTVTPMSGVFTIYLSPPKTEEEINQNPLGIYISDFNWAKEASTKEANSK